MAVLHQPQKKMFGPKRKSGEETALIVDHPIVLIPNESSEATHAPFDPKPDRMRQRFDTQAVTPVSNTGSVEAVQNRIGPATIHSLLTIEQQETSPPESPKEQRPSQQQKQKVQREVLPLKTAIIAPEDMSGSIRNRSMQLDLFNLETTVGKRKKSPKRNADEVEVAIRAESVEQIMTGGQFSSPLGSLSVHRHGKSNVERMIESVAIRQASNQSVSPKISDNVFESIDSRARESHDKNRVHLNLDEDISYRLQKFNIRLTEQRGRKSPRSLNPSELLEHAANLSSTKRADGASPSPKEPPSPPIPLAKIAEQNDHSPEGMKAVTLRKSNTDLAEVEGGQTYSSVALESVMMPGTQKYNNHQMSSDGTQELQQLLRVASIKGKETTSRTSLVNGSKTLQSKIVSPSTVENRLGVAQIFADALVNTGSSTEATQPLQQQVLHFPPVAVKGQGATPGSVETAPRSELFASFAKPGASEHSQTLDAVYPSSDNPRLNEVTDIDVQNSLEVVVGPVQAPFKFTSRRQSGSHGGKEKHRSSSRGSPRAVNTYAQRVLLEHQQSESTVSVGLAPPTGPRGATLHSGRGGASAVLNRQDRSFDENVAGSAELSQDLRHVIDDQSSSPPRQLQISPHSQKYFEKNFSTIIQKGQVAVVGAQMPLPKDGHARPALPGTVRPVMKPGLQKRAAQADAHTFTKVNSEAGPSLSQPDDEASQETARAEHLAANHRDSSQKIADRVMFAGEQANFAEGIQISVSNVGLPGVSPRSRQPRIEGPTANSQLNNVPAPLQNHKKESVSIAPFKTTSGPASPPDFTGIGQAGQAKIATPTSVEQVPKNVFKSTKDRERSTISKMKETRRPSNCRSAHKERTAEGDRTASKSLNVGRVPSPRSSNEHAASAAPYGSPPDLQSPGHGDRSFDLRAAESGEDTQECPHPLNISKKKLVAPPVISEHANALSRTRGDLGGQASAREVICFKLLNEKKQQQSDIDITHSPDRRKVQRRLTGMPSSYLMTDKSSPAVAAGRLGANGVQGQAVLEQVTSASKQTSEGRLISPPLPPAARGMQQNESSESKGVAVGPGPAMIKVPRPKPTNAKERARVQPRERPAAGAKPINRIQIQFQPGSSEQEAMNETLRTTLRSTAFGGVIFPAGMAPSSPPPPPASQGTTTYFTHVECLTPKIMTTNLGANQAEINSQQWKGLEQAFAAHQLFNKHGDNPNESKDKKRKIKNEYLSNFQSRRELVELRQRKNKLQLMMNNSLSPKARQFQRYANETCVTLENNNTPGLLNGKGAPRSHSSSRERSEEVQTMEGRASFDSQQRGSNSKGFNMQRAIRFSKLSKERREQIQLSLSLQDARGSRDVIVREESQEETTEAKLAATVRRGSGEIAQWNDRRRSNGSLHMSSTAGQAFMPGSQKASINKILGTQSSEGGPVTLGGEGRSNVQLVDAGAQMTVAARAADLAAVSSSEEGGGSPEPAPKVSGALLERLVLNEASEKAIIPQGSSGSATGASPSKEHIEHSRTMSGGFGVSPVLEVADAEASAGVTPQPAAAIQAVRDASMSAGGPREAEPLSTVLADNVTHATIIEEANSADISRTGEGHNVGVGVTELSVQLGSNSPSRIGEDNDHLPQLNLKPVNKKDHRGKDPETEQSIQSIEDGMPAPSDATIPLVAASVAPGKSLKQKHRLARKNAKLTDSQEARKLNLSTVSIDYEDLLQPDPAFDAAQDTMRIRSRASPQRLLGVHNSAHKSFDSYQGSAEASLFGAQRRISRDETLKQQLRDYLSQKAEPRAATLHDVLDGASKANRGYGQSFGGPNDALLKGAFLQKGVGKSHPFASVLGGDEELELLKKLACARPQLRYVKRTKNKGYWERKKGHAPGGASVPVGEQIISPYSQEYERLCLLYSGPKQQIDKPEDEEQRRLQALLLKHTRRITSISRNQFSGTAEPAAGAAMATTPTKNSERQYRSGKSPSVVNQKQVLDLVVQHSPPVGDRSAPGQSLQLAEHRRIESLPVPEVKLARRVMQDSYQVVRDKWKNRRRSSRVPGLHTRNMEDAASKNTLVDPAMGHGSQLSNQYKLTNASIDQARSPSELNHNDLTSSRVKAQLAHFGQPEDSRQRTIENFGYGLKKDMVDEATSACFGSSYGGAIASQAQQSASGGQSTMRLSPVGSLDRVNRNKPNAFNIAISGESGLLKQAATIDVSKGSTRDVKQLMAGMQHSVPISARNRMGARNGKLNVAALRDQQRNISFNTAKRNPNDFGSTGFAPASTLLAAGTSIVSPKGNADLVVHANSTMRSPQYGGTRLTSQTGDRTLEQDNSSMQGASHFDKQGPETVYFAQTHSPFTPSPLPSGDHSLGRRDARVIKLPDVYKRDTGRISPESPMDNQPLRPRVVKQNISSRNVLPKNFKSKVKSKDRSAERRPESKSILVVHGAEAGSGGGSRRVSPLGARGHVTAQDLDPLDVIIDSQQSKHRRRTAKGSGSPSPQGGDASDPGTAMARKPARKPRPSPTGAGSKMTAASRHQKKIEKHLQQVKSAMSSHAKLSAKKGSEASIQNNKSPQGLVTSQTGNMRSTGMKNQDSQTAFAELGPDPLS